jgi:hypothetical protein
VNRLATVTGKVNLYLRLMSTFLSRSLHHLSTSSDIYGVYVSLVRHTLAISLSSEYFTVQINCTQYSPSFIWQRPPLWSSGQSSWLQIRRPGIDSRHYPPPPKKNVVGMERGPLSLSCSSGNKHMLQTHAAVTKHFTSAVLQLHVNLIIIYLVQ